MNIHRLCECLLGSFWLEEATGLDPKQRAVEPCLSKPSTATVINLLIIFDLLLVMTRAQIEIINLVDANTVGGHAWLGHMVMLLLLLGGRIALCQCTR